LRLVRRCTEAISAGLGRSSVRCPALSDQSELAVRFSVAIAR